MESRNGKQGLGLHILAEITTVDRTDFLVISRNAATLEEIRTIKAEEFAYQKLARYDPAVYGQFGMEPLEEMKKFRVDN